MKKNLQKTARKGQVTAFVILGGVILLLILLVIGLKPLFVKNESGGKVALASQAEDVKSYIDRCLKELAEDGLVEMGAHGGVISPEEGLTTFYSKISYAYNGKKTFPEIQALEKELSNYVSDNMRKRCDLTVFKDLEVTENNRVRVETSFKDTVMISMYWLVTVRKANMTFEYKEFKTELPVRMEKVWEITNTIIADPKKAELESYLSNLEDVVINRYAHEGLQSVYMIRDYKSEIKDKDYYIFAFAIKP